jgi:hypothetical protein
MMKLSLALLLASVALVEGQSQWPSTKEIERISIAAAVADYPMAAADAKEILGLPQYTPLIQGGGPSTHGPAWALFALSNPETPEGCYAIRLKYLPEPAPPPRDPRPSGDTNTKTISKTMISDIEIVYWTPSPYFLLRVERPEFMDSMRKMRQDSKMNPRDFSQRLVDQKEILPNQPPRMPVTGTPAASAPVAPTPGIAGR